MSRTDRSTRRQPQAASRPPMVVIGVGNPFRRDDGAGIEAARLLRDIVPEGVEVFERDGEPAALLDAFEIAPVAYVIDAVVSDDPPGRVHRIELGGEGDAAVPSSPRRDSSHALGLGDAVALARALDRLPERLVLIGITGASFEAGDELTPAVRRAVKKIAASVARELAQLQEAD
ncbi:MAG TPA: hydrogenase maturation protease [Egibacteraceae bacterium]|nr:hydrogenase maturation protease [Egibacteraceae bacterium]